MVKVENSSFPKGVGKSTFIITFFSVLNVLAGFILQILLAAKFGAKGEMDAYFAAATLPQLVMMALLGALNVTFIPIFIQYEARRKDELWRIVSSFINLMFIVFASISLIGILFSSGIISLIAPGLTGETYLLSVKLVKIIFPAIIFYALASLFSSIYYAHQRFARPSFAPVLNYLVIVCTVLFLHSVIGITSIAIGMLLGGIAQFLFLLPAVFGKYQVIFDFKNEAVVKIYKLMFPLVLAAIFSKANNLIERFFASSLSEGSISYLGYAYKIMIVLSMLSTRGISLSLFPIMSKNVTKYNFEKLRENFSFGIKMALIIVVPLIVGVIIMAEPVIQLLLERGRFTHQATLAVSFSLFGYIGALFALSIGNVLTKVFYACQETLIVAKVSIFGAILNIILAYFFSKFWGYIGLAAAFSIVSIVNMTIFLIILNKKGIGIDMKGIRNTFYKISLISGIVGILIFFTKNGIDSVHLSRFTGGIAVTLIIICSIAVYFYLGLVFKIPEFYEIKERIYKIFKMRIYG